MVFQPYGRRVKVAKGTTVLRAALEAGIGIRSICGGRGLCGKCKVIVRSGKVEFDDKSGADLVSSSELEQGVVLACLSRIESDSEIFIPPESRIEGQRLQTEARLPRVPLKPLVRRIYVPISKIDDIEEIARLLGVNSDVVKEKVLPIAYDSEEGVTVTISEAPGEAEIVEVVEGNRAEEVYGLAVDIGTTKVVAYLADLSRGEFKASASEYNRQLVYGEDVVSRVSYAMDNPNGEDELQRAVVDTINSLVERLAVKTGIDRSDIVDVTVAGNTIMTYLFVKENAEPLLQPGYKIERREGFLLRAGEIGLKVNGGAYVYCLPSAGRFLGGDVIGDVLLSGMYERPEISLLIDIGTNIEVVLGCEGWFLTTTAAAGPAFEGWGIKFGSRAVEGAVDHVEIDDKTYRAKYTVIGNKKPLGICGSGLIDLLSEMFRIGLVDESGKINRKLDIPLIREGGEGYEYVVVPAEETAIGKDIVITEKDIMNLIDAKAAACASVSVLLKKMRLTIYDIKEVFVCGAFGSYLNLSSAISIGLIPEFPGAKFTYLGNGSVAGSYLCLLSADYRRKAEEIAKITSYIDLLKDADFMDEYMAAYRLPGKRDLFPTWWERMRRK